MPLVRDSTYRSSPFIPGGHLQTIYPALFRRAGPVTGRPERLELPDGDFIDLEWAGQGSDRLAIISHGLEADMWSGYIQGMAAALVRNGRDVLVWNFRGCGNEPNRLLRMYHSGRAFGLNSAST
jgi:predicted alpha/beta-fold hydrolase